MRAWGRAAIPGHPAPTVHRAPYGSWSVGNDSSGILEEIELLFTRADRPRARHSPAPPRPAPAAPIPARTPAFLPRRRQALTGEGRARGGPGWRARRRGGAARRAAAARRFRAGFRAAAAASPSPPHACRRRAAPLPPPQAPEPGARPGAPRRAHARRHGGRRSARGRGRGVAGPPRRGAGARRCVGAERGRQWGAQRTARQRTRLPRDSARPPVARSRRPPPPPPRPPAPAAQSPWACSCRPSS
jgi:hypothetical protein